MYGKSQNFSLFIRDFDRHLFFDSISQFNGTIDLVWDGKKLMRQLNGIVTPKLLSDHANIVKNFTLETASNLNADNVVYLLNPSQRSVQLLIKNWIRNIPSESSQSHHVLFIPEETYKLKEQLKEDQTIWNRISTVGSIPLHWFPCEQAKLITMDLPELPSQLLINGDWNYLFKCAKSLKLLIGQLNQNPNFHCKGEWSARIVEILKKLPDNLADKNVGITQIDFPPITDIVIIDRWLDPLTPMLKQFTFAGECDEFFGIDSRGMIKIPLDELEEKETTDTEQSASNKNKETQTKEIQLNDQVFEQLQDLNVNNVAFKLREIVDELKVEEQHRKSLASLTEYKSFVAKLPNVVSRRKSTGIFMRLAGVIQRYETHWFYRGVLRCEQQILKNPQPDKIHPFIENSLIEMKDLNTIMRLIILQALVSRGLKPFIWQAYTKLIVQGYGISELTWVLKLQLAGLFRDENLADSKIEIHYPVMNFSQLCKRYKLSSMDLHEMRLTDNSNSSGNASLLLHMIEEGIQTNWSDFTTVSMGSIILNQVADEQSTHDAVNKTDLHNRQTLIFVIGGITRSEMSMLNQNRHKLICCTTAIVNANHLLDSFRI